MKITTTDFDGLLVIEPQILQDARGYFYESYNEKEFHQAGITTRFVQDNQSYSVKGVVRGLHYQTAPFAQTKLVRVLIGSIQDVVVDLRRSSPLFGKHFSINLSSENKQQLFVPKGFAHGFMTLSDTATILYKCDEFYHPEAERGIYFNDKDLKIKWELPDQNLIISEKDQKNPFYKEVNTLF